MPSLYRVLSAALFVCLGATGPHRATAQTLSNPTLLNGFVEDPSGARVPHARILIQSKDLSRETVTDSIGRFSVELPIGTYEITVEFTGFRPSVSTVDLAGKENVTLGVELVIATQAEEVAVASDPGSSTSAAENDSALIIKGALLDTLSADDAAFQNEVLAMAGGAGDTPQLFVDGFSGARFPPRNSIQAIRINRNPFSAQYDTMGLSRIEIDTKPGGGPLHGSLAVLGTDGDFNSRDPFTTGIQPPYYILNLSGTLSGGLGKRTSFFTNGTYNDQQNNTVVNALTPTPVSEAVPTPQALNTYAASLRNQATPNQQFSVRYEFSRVTQSNAGVGLFVLPSEGSNVATTTQTLQLASSTIIGTRTINQARFQYIRSRLHQEPAITDPSLTDPTGRCPRSTSLNLPSCTIMVEGAFNGGGDPFQYLHDNQDHFEFQDFLSFEYKKHFIRAGGRYRLLRESNNSTANYNGQFTFPDLASYAANTPSLFTLTTGQTSAEVRTGDLGAYLEDEWKAARNLTVNYGFRFESQTAIPDHFDPAPRAGASWAIGPKTAKTPIVVLRVGAGMFYDRFPASDLLTSVRQNGTSQQTYSIGNPTLSPVLNSSTPATPWRVARNLRSAYDILSEITADRSLGKYGTVSVNYVAGRGDHQYLSLNINAPLPGTYIYNPTNPADANSGTRPFGGSGNIYQFSSAGSERAHIFFFNTRLHFGKRFSTYSSFVSIHNQTDYVSPTDFPSNQYNISQDTGPEAIHRREQFYLGGSGSLPLRISADFFLSAQSGAPYNITTGTDYNGDTQYNDRPYLANGTTPNGSTIKSVPGCGTFAQPGSQPSGATVAPMNACTGPGLLYLQLALHRSFAFGPHKLQPAVAGAAPAPGAAPFQMTFGVEADNVLNHVIAANPVGILNSQFFGQTLSPANSFTTNTASNRVIQLQTTFIF